MARRIMMKKKTGLQVVCAGLALAGIMLSGCATSKIFDKQSAKAKEQSSVLLSEAARGGNISIDGKPVVYSGSGSFTLVIPSGEHTVLISRSLSYTVGTEYISAEYKKVTYIPYMLKSYTAFEFEPNKKYRLENILPKLRYNGRTLESSDAGVTVTTSQAGDVFVDNSGLEVKEAGTMPFSTYIGYESQFEGLLAGWVKEMLPTGFGMGFGVSVIRGKLEMNLLGETGAGVGFSVPDMAALGAGYFVYGGGLAKIFFSKTALEFGGGMIAGNNGLLNMLNPGDPPPGRNFAAPYLKAGFLFQKGWDQEWGLYGLYFLGSEDEEWYNQFGIGVHYHSH
jgi:hypothetical protein